MKPSEKDKLYSIFEHHFLIPSFQLKKRKYLEDLGLSKLEQKEMINYFEEEFKIQVSEQDERKIRTINDTMTVLDKYLGYNQNQLKAG